MIAYQFLLEKGCQRKFLDSGTPITIHISILLLWKILCEEGSSSMEITPHKVVRAVQSNIGKKTKKIIGSLHQGQSTGPDK